MENKIPEFSQEQMDKVVESKAQEIYEMFKNAITTAIPDSVSQENPNLVHEVAKECSLAHIVPFLEPLTKMPTDMVNGAAKERLELVQNFWGGVRTVLTAM